MKRTLSVILLMLALIPIGTGSGTAVQQCSATVDWDEEEARVVGMVNTYRESRGLPKLARSYRLTRAATWKAEDMARNNYFSHYDSLGRDPFQMQNDCGYTYNTWRGENLGGGTNGTAEQIVRLWQESPGHDSILLGPEYTAVGVARALGPWGDQCCYWYWAYEAGGVRDCPAEYTGDDYLSITDLTSFLVPVRRLGGTDPDYDLTHDGAVTLSDLFALLPLWRPC